MTPSRPTGAEDAGRRDAPGAGPPASLDGQEVSALLDHLFVRTGIDLGRYSQAAMRRRLHHIMLQDGVPTLGELRARVAGPPAALRLAAFRMPARRWKVQFQSRVGEPGGAASCLCRKKKSSRPSVC